MQAVIDRGLDSALVLEDDVDWDVRLKAQMVTFAAASRTWLRRAKRVRTAEESEIVLSPQLLASRMTTGKTESPYGDNWDVLWLGHCGTELPLLSSSSSSAQPGSLKILIPSDETVPAPQHLKPHPFASRDALGSAYPAHTRVVHAARGNACTLAYAVSGRGAEKVARMFQRVGYVAQWDLMLRDYCLGLYRHRRGGVLGDEGGEREEAPVCVTVQPPLFSHYYAGAEEGGGRGGASVSDIRGQGGGFASRKTGTPYVRLSVQGNLERIVAGVPVGELVDQLPDDKDAFW